LRPALVYNASRNQKNVGGQSGGRRQSLLQLWGVSRRKRFQEGAV
jgi:hypothetical protein